MTTLILALALTGQRQCATAQSYAVQQAAVTYAAPTYAVQAAAPVYQTTTVWVATETPYAELVNGTARQAAQAQAATDLTDLVQRLADSVERIERKIGGEPVGSAATATPPPPKPEPPAVAPAKVVAILRDNCLKCHGPDKPKGDLQLFGEGGNLLNLSALDLLRIDQATYAGSMPPKGALDEQAYSDIRAWINERRPEIAALLKGAKTTRTESTKTPESSR